MKNNNSQSMIKEICKTTVLGIGSIKRYNTIYRIHEETVAEHSMYVAYNVMRLCDILNIDPMIKLKAIEMAIVHDLPETFTSDVCYTTKVRRPELSKILAELELEDMRRHMPEVSDKFEEFQKAEEEGTIEGQLVKLADAISVVQYCEIEKSLGNSSEDITEILCSSYTRVENRLNILLKSLEK